jgi:hypothetical protein
MKHRARQQIPSRDRSLAPPEAVMRGWCRHAESVGSAKVGRLCARIRGRVGGWLGLKGQVQYGVLLLLLAHNFKEQPLLSAAECIHACSLNPHARERPLRVQRPTPLIESAIMHRLPNIPLFSTIRRSRFSGSLVAARPRAASLRAWKALRPSAQRCQRERPGSVCLRQRQTWQTPQSTTPAAEPQKRRERPSTRRRSVCNCRLAARWRRQRGRGSAVLMAAQSPQALVAPRFAASLPHLGNVRWS